MILFLWQFGIPGPGGRPRRSKAALRSPSALLQIGATLICFMKPCRNDASEEEEEEESIDRIGKSRAAVERDTENR